MIGTRLHSGAFHGINAVPLSIVIGLTRGASTIMSLGFPSELVLPIKTCVMAALAQNGYHFPGQEITIQALTSPQARITRACELPIAVGLLLASGHMIPEHALASVLFAGELALDGTLLHTAGILPLVVQARMQGYHAVFIPAANVQEASLVDGISIYPVETLAQLIAHLTEIRLITPLGKERSFVSLAPGVITQELADIRGHEVVKRVLEVAASGGHHLVLSGPPGCGKTLLARALPSLLPPLEFQEHGELTTLASVSGALSPERPVVRERPVQTLYAETKRLALRGEGMLPGTLSQVHRGVLIMEDLCAFRPDVLRLIEQAMETGQVSADDALTMPAHFQLVATMLPCPCGFFNDPLHECTCSAQEIMLYLERVRRLVQHQTSLHMEVPRLSSDVLMEKHAGETSAGVRLRVQAARDRQRERLLGTGIRLNAEMRPAEIQRFCLLENGAQKLLRSAVTQLMLTPRTIYQVMAVARTIADLAERDQIMVSDLAEAIQYRARM